MAVLLAIVIAVGAVAIARAHQSSGPPTGPGPSGEQARQASLAEAIKSARVVGPTDPAKRLIITLTLSSRSADQLNGIINSGGTVSPSSFAQQFGPDPAQVQAAIAALKRLNVDARWDAGSSILIVTAPVSVINSVLGVQITDYKGADGREFYAPNRPVVIPQILTSVVTGVAGLDNFQQLQGKATILTAIHAKGLTPEDVLAFYNINPLRQRGLDGSGVTIVIPEIDDLPDGSDLHAFSQRFNLPEADLTIQRNPEWGDPIKKGEPGGEATLDVEVVHAIAPKAKIIVYVGSPSLQEGIILSDAMVRDNPGAIISDSLGQCEAGVPDAIRAQAKDIWDRAAATGMTHYVASGDLGAYDCAGHPDILSVDFPSALPSLTTVGGTSVFLAAKPGYLREVAWGDAISGSGSGGGVSLNYPRPDWQKGTGVDNGDSGSPPMRQVPDVAGVSDTNTGWDIILGGAEHQFGGTSAAAPLWAGITALIGQDMAGKGLKPVGFANPALYWMAQQSDLSPAPFHDVLIGNNFRYHATVGWDFVTGWGTPDVDALDSAWQRFQRQNGGGG